MAADLLGGLLPAPARVVEVFDDSAPVELFPEERAVVARAVDKRRREFASVRHCARLALAELGRPAAPILPGERGAPIWPAGVSGSMTHCDGYRAAAVAERTRIASLGIDAEPHDRLPDGVLRVVAVPEEHRMLDRLARGDPDTHWGRILFSAKEALYKTWFPMTRTWLGFHQAVIDIHPDIGVFRARVLIDGHGDIAGTDPQVFEGRWLVRRGLALTAIAHPPLTPWGDP